jgi:cell division protease FtsH
LSEKEQRITAYHEMGHALVGHFLENTDPVHKITIVPRGQALGLTISLPTEDRYIMGKLALIETIAMTLGGRAAEDLVFHEVTTGASNDLEKVTDIAKRMVMRYGMSDKLGPRVLGRNGDMPFLGLGMGHQPDYSEEIAREIDDEVRRIIEEGYESALDVLREHMADLHRISQTLIERETIDKDQFVRLLDGETEEQVFDEEATEPSPEPAAEPRTRAPRQPRPFPLPGSAMQPPEPNAAN